MKWTIRVELTPDGNPPITYDIGTITRPIADLSPEQIGLTIEDGQQLLRRIQVKVIASQAHAYALCRRTCVECGRPKRIKDIRTKCVQTVFGAFRFRGRRYRACGCRDHPGGFRHDFPLGEIIPRRTTPKVRYFVRRTWRWDAVSGGIPGAQDLCIRPNACKPYGDPASHARYRPRMSTSLFSGQSFQQFVTRFRSRIAK